MRQYTWDKHLETWVKASGILGGPKNESPTVISPKQYKKRFRKAMTTYFLMVPDQWSPPTIIPSQSQTDLCEENTQDGTSVEWYCKFASVIVALFLLLPKFLFSYVFPSFFPFFSFTLLKFFWIEVPFCTFFCCYSQNSFRTCRARPAKPFKFLQGGINIRYPPQGFFCILSSLYLALYM